MIADRTNHGGCMSLKVTSRSERAALLPFVGFCFLPNCLTDLAAIARDNLTMRTLAVIFVLALITIAFEIYSDAALMSAEVSRPEPDPATTAVAHALKRG
jgi:hypothetical protein